MNYHLKRAGEDLGNFSLDELRRRRASGELTGTETVWTAGMPGWEPLDSILRQIFPPPLPPGPPPLHKPKANRTGIKVLAIVIGGLLAAAVVIGVVVTRVAPRLKAIANRVQQIDQEQAGEDSALVSASEPVTVGTNVQTAADVWLKKREFRLRQYVEGYTVRGDRNPTSDALALGFLQNWIACNFGGTVDTNLPPLNQLSDQLARDPACTDPLVLTVSGVNAIELHEAIRRLEHSVSGFENSKHLGYPKFYATVTLAEKLIHDRADRLPALDALALQRLNEAFADGSLLPGDEAELGETLTAGWGRAFFDRNAIAVCSLAAGQGKRFQWLALVLKGEKEISAAWQARGGGYVNTVSEKGWQGFRDHLSAARRDLEAAWKLQPKQPLAPCRMIYVSLGDGGIGEMRRWFDRTMAAQIDYPLAWTHMRWGLRPRWYGGPDSMLAFGITALSTRRFDTDVPRMFFDSVSDLEAELDLPQGQHIYGRADIWPHLQELYEGYIADPKTTAPDGWRSTYAVIAYLAGKYDISEKQLQAINWKPYPANLIDWSKDLSLMPLEVSARTGSRAKQVAEAESHRDSGDPDVALELYQAMAADLDVDERTRLFLRERLVTLDIERRLKAGDWVSWLPTDTNFNGWHVAFGDCRLLPDGALEVRADAAGHMLYSRARVGLNFEVRGQFEVVSSSQAFQAGLVMGVPQVETRNWYAFRVKRNADEGEVASFSPHWSKPQILTPAHLNSGTNSFSFRLRHGRVNATINGQEVFKSVAPPQRSQVTTNEVLLGLGAFNDSNDTIIRYRNVQARQLPTP